MINEQIQLLRDENITPTNDIIADGLGNVHIIFSNFVEELKKYNITLMDWRYYNDGKAWLSKGEYKWSTTRGTKKVKPIFWLSIWEGFFKISFFFSIGVQEELQSLHISQDAKELIKNASSKGKTMKFIPIVFNVNNEKQLNDLFELSKFRKEKI